MIDINHKFSKMKQKFPLRARVMLRNGILEHDANDYIIVGKNCSRYISHICSVLNDLFLQTTRPIEYEVEKTPSKEEMSDYEWKKRLIKLSKEIMEKFTESDNLKCTDHNWQSKTHKAGLFTFKAKDGSVHVTNLTNIRNTLDKFITFALNKNLQLDGLCESNIMRVDGYSIYTIDLIIQFALFGRILYYDKTDPNINSLHFAPERLITSGY